MADRTLSAEQHALLATLIQDKITALNASGDGPEGALSAAQEAEKAKLIELQANSAAAQTLDAVARETHAAQALGEANAGTTENHDASATTGGFTFHYPPASQDGAPEGTVIEPSKKLVCKLYCVRTANQFLHPAMTAVNDKAKIPRMVLGIDGLNTEKGHVLTQMWNGLKHQVLNVQHKDVTLTVIRIHLEDNAQKFREDRQSFLADVCTDMAIKITKIESCHAPLSAARMVLEESIKSALYLSLFPAASNAASRASGANFVDLTPKALEIIFSKLDSLTQQVNRYRSNEVRIGYRAAPYGQGGRFANTAENPITISSSESTPVVMPPPATQAAAGGPGTPLHLSGSPAKPCANCKRARRYNIMTTHKVHECTQPWVLNCSTCGELHRNGACQPQQAAGPQ